MAQLSPRIFNLNLEDEQNMSFGSAAGLSPRSQGAGSISLSPGRNSDFFPSTSTGSPRLPRHPDPDPAEGPMCVLFSFPSRLVFVGKF